MAEHSRRAFIRGAGVTAAAATVAVMVPGVASAASKSPSESPSDDGTPAPDGSVVAFVKDAKAGNITVMRGEREVQITDKALARKLAKLTQL
jgi:phage baseplate assembly protein gpV